MQEILKKNLSEKQITAEFTQIQVLLNNESMQKLKDLKSLYSHQVPDGNLNQLFAILIHNAIENHPLNRRMKSKGSHSDKHPKAIDLIEVNSESRNTEEVNHLHSINNNLNQQKLEKREINHKNVAQPEQYKKKAQCIINNQFNKEKSSAELQTSKSINNRIRNLHNNISPKHQKKQRQNIPISTKRIIFARANGQCEFHSANGQRCQSRHQLEYDHIQSVSFGGGNSIDNLQLLCRQHNQYKVLHTHGFNYQMRDQT